MQINDGSRLSFHPLQAERKLDLFRQLMHTVTQSVILCVDEMGSRGFSSHTKQISVQE